MIQVDVTRPYEPLGMTTALWQLIPPTSIDVRSLADAGRLVLSQNHLDAFALIAGTGPMHDAHPHLVRDCLTRLVYVVDGHHRIVRALLGHHLVLARIKEIPCLPG